MIFIFAARHGTAKPGEQLPPEFLGWIFAVIGSALFVIGIAIAICNSDRRPMSFPLRKALLFRARDCLHRMSFRSVRNDSRVFTIVALSRESVRALFAKVPRKPRVVTTSRLLLLGDGPLKNLPKQAPTSKSRNATYSQARQVWFNSHYLGFPFARASRRNCFRAGSFHVQSPRLSSPVGNFDPATTRMTACARGHPDHVLPFLLPGVACPAATGFRSTFTWVA